MNDNTSDAKRDRAGGDSQSITVRRKDSGKSTRINAIAGTRLHAGNWPGK